MKFPKNFKAIPKTLVSLNTKARQLAFQRKTKEKINNRGDK